mmetsp:Transcript_30437/g.98926  ORF Transcript_30437/g.98926 Transcript_30437/m.98926 type:complete len:228 (+) Transcript_30437:1041-1724(+)
MLYHSATAARSSSLLMTPSATPSTASADDATRATSSSEGASPSFRSVKSVFSCSESSVPDLSMSYFAKISSTHSLSSIKACQTANVSASSIVVMGASSWSSALNIRLCTIRITHFTSSFSGEYPKRSFSISVTSPISSLYVRSTSYLSKVSLEAIAILSSSLLSPARLRRACKRAFAPGLPTTIDMASEPEKANGFRTTNENVMNARESSRVMCTSRTTKAWARVLP